MTTVVNLRVSPYDVYIGRAGRGFSGEFGNSHSIGYCPICKTEHDRESCISEFKKDFLIRIKQDENFRNRVLELRGKVLGCFCKPLDCHGDVYKEWLDNNPTP